MTTSNFCTFPPSLPPSLSWGKSSQIVYFSDQIVDAALLVTKGSQWLMKTAKIQL